MKPAIFIDRDGTLIEEVNYLSRVEDLRLFPSTADAIKLFKEKGFLVIVVTNQSGIGRGIYTEADMHDVHHAIQSQLHNAIDAFYFCPHIPDAGCECRKPRLGMINSARADLEIDMENSWMVGDKKIDVETGINAGIKTAFVLTGYGTHHRDLLETTPDVIASNLGEAAIKIIGYPTAVARTH